MNKLLNEYTDDELFTFLYDAQEAARIALEDIEEYSFEIVRRYVGKQLNQSNANE